MPTSLNTANVSEKKKDRFLVYLMEILQIIQTNSLENAEQKKKIKKKTPRPETFDILPSAWITNNSIFYRIFDLFIFFSP